MASVSDPAPLEEEEEEESDGDYLSVVARRGAGRNVGKLLHRFTKVPQNAAKLAGRGWLKSIAEDCEL